MIFAFEFQLTIDKLTKPAAEAKKAVMVCAPSMWRSRRRAERGQQRHRAEGKRPPAWRRETATSGRKIADEWQRMAAEKSARRSITSQEREPSSASASQEREARATRDPGAASGSVCSVRARRKAAHGRGENESTKLANGCGPASRSLRKAQHRTQGIAQPKRQPRAAEAAAHKPWFGGKQVCMELLSRARIGQSLRHGHRRCGLRGGLPGHGARRNRWSVMAESRWRQAQLLTRELQRRCAMNFAKMAISAQAMREQSIASFAAVYGNQGVAEKLFDQSVRIAKLTKFDTPEVVDVMNTLAANRFTAEQLPMLFAAYGDVAGARGSTKGAQYLRGLSSLNAAPSALRRIQAGFRRRTRRRAWPWKCWPTGWASRRIRR